MIGSVLVLAAEEHADNGFFFPGDIKEFYWGLGAFLIVFALLAWKVFPLVGRLLSSRADRIEADLNAADEAQAAVDAELAAAKSKLADADTEAQAIIAGAQDNAVRLKAEMAERAEIDAAALKARANDEIEAARRQVQAELQAEVNLATLAAAEEVVRSNLDDAAQVALIDRYIEQVGA